MVFWQLLCGMPGLSARGDYPPGSMSKNESHLAIFMTLFMVCAAEVVVLKLLTYDPSQETRNTAATLWFNMEM